jgi:hypothetical protein
VHAHRGPHGPAQVGLAARAHGLGAPGAPPGRGEPHPGHDPAQRGELLGGAGVEGLAPQRFRRGGHQAELGLLLVAVTGLIGAGHVEHGPIHLRGDLRGQREQLTGRVAAGQEVHAEHPVVDLDVVPPADQRGAARPVQVEQIGGVQRRHRRAVGQQVTRADGQPRSAQRRREAGQDGGEVPPAP